MKVVIYARVSSDSQDVDLSISAQLRALRDFAMKHGHQLVREFVDEAESGRTADRPAFREMIALAKMRPSPFEAILVWKLNRFARSRVDSITYKTLLKSKGIKVVSINEPLDDSPAGQMLEGVIEVIDEFYSTNLGQDIKRGMRENAQRGFFNGSRPPYGLKKVPVQDGGKTRYKLEPDSDNAQSVKTIRRMFDLAKKDIGCKQIAKTLNSEGIRTSTGQCWGKTTAYKVLTNEAYCGILVWGDQQGHRSPNSDCPAIRVEKAWPAIIDKETFTDLQKRMMHKRPNATHPRTVPSFYLLSGFLFCSCGHAMIGRSAKSHQYYYYACNEGLKKGNDICGARALPKDKLEELIVDEVKSKILNQESLTELVKLVNQELDSSHDMIKDRLEAIDTELNDVRSRLSKLYDALETGKICLEDLSPRIRELRLHQDELNQRRLETEVEGIGQEVKHVDAETIKSYAEDLKSILEEADIAESKAFLRSFIKRVEVRQNEAEIFYNLPIPSGGGSQSTTVLPMVTFGGAEGIRTPDPLNANQMLYR